MKLDELVSHITNVKGLVDKHYFTDSNYPKETIDAVREVLDWFALDTIERMQKPMPLTFEEWCEAVAMSRTTHDLSDAVAYTLCKAFSVNPKEPQHSTLMKFLSFNPNHERYPHGFVVHFSTREHPDGKEYEMDRAASVYEYMCDIYRDEL